MTFTLDAQVAAVLAAAAEHPPARWRMCSETPE